MPLTNTWSTTSSNASTNIREDVSDIIYRITPTQTPVLTMASKAKATNTLHEWLVQELDNAANNEQVEGAEATAGTPDINAKAVTAAVRLNNRTQISSKVVGVSGTQRAVNQIGRKDELGYQVSLAALELKRDMEVGLTQNSVLATSPRRSRGLRGWIVDNVNNNGGTLASYTGNTAYTAGTQRAFTEAQVKDVLQKVYTAGGEPDYIMMPPAAKQTFSGFTGNATRMDKSEDAKLYSSVDFYVSDFGTLQCVPNRFMATREAFVLQSDKLAIAYLRPFQTMDLAPTGDAERKMILAEYCLECRAPKAHGAIYDIL